MLQVNFYIYWLKHPPSLVRMLKRVGQGQESRRQQEHDARQVGGENRGRIMGQEQGKEQGAGTGEGAGGRNRGRSRG